MLARNYAPVVRFSYPNVPPDLYGSKYIYCLVDPCTSRVCYVGQTQSPGMRLRAHCSENYGPGEKECWMRGLRAMRVQPIFLPLEIVPNAEARMAERRWIAQGEPLFNWQHTGRGTSAYRYSKRLPRKVA
jgi:hypothetical protein